MFNFFKKGVKKMKLEELISAAQGLSDDEKKKLTESLQPHTNPAAEAKTEPPAESAAENPVKPETEKVGNTAEPKQETPKEPEKTEPPVQTETTVETAPASNPTAAPDIAALTQRVASLEQKLNQFAQTPQKVTDTDTLGKLEKARNIYES